MPLKCEANISCASSDYSMEELEIFYTTAALTTTSCPMQFVCS